MAGFKQLLRWRRKIAKMPVGIEVVRQPTITICHVERDLFKSVTTRKPANATRRNESVKDYCEIKSTKKIA
jgi:hypothetical protein